MNVVRTSTTVLLAATALLGIGAGVASAGTPTPRTTAVRSAAASWSRGYNFYNTSTVPMVFSGQSWATGIPMGSVVDPGQSLHFEVPYDGGSMEYSTLQFTPKAGYGATGHLSFTLLIVNALNDTSSWSGDSLQGLTGITNGSSLYALNPAGTTINLDGGNDQQAQGIATALHQLCDTTSLAACSFDSTKEDPSAWGSMHQVGNSVVNDENDPAVFKTTETDTIGVTDNVGVTLKAGGSLFGLVNAEVDLAYNHSVTTTHGFTDEVDMTVQSGDTAWVLDTAPVIRDYGNFTITMGNTTYNLSNVSFDSPDTTRNGQWMLCSKQAKIQCPLGPTGPAIHL